MEQPFSIFTLGDSAITLDLGNRIDEELNKKALAISFWLRSHLLPGIKDIVVAYSSVTIYYDPGELLLEHPVNGESKASLMKRLLRDAWEAISGRAPSPEARAEGMDPVLKSTPGQEKIVRLPVCYEGEFGPDLEEICRIKGIDREELIRLHTASTYRVYMIGFLPGFPYLGKLDSRLETERKEKPVPVVAGGVGIAGSQTGIYTLDSPGGWHIIGRTPVTLFDPCSASPVVLKAGDRVRFFPIPKEDFVRLSMS